MTLRPRARLTAVLLALASLTGNGVRLARSYGWPALCASAIAVGAAQLAASPPVGLIVGGAFGLLGDWKLSRR